MKETLSEMVANITPKDELEIAEEGHFKGKTYVYRESRSGLLVATAVHFDAHPKRPLDPFLYQRPIENPDRPFDKPEEIDRTQGHRVNYYPVAIVKNARRPNHLYEPDNGIVTVVKGIEGKGSLWWIRYFPSNTIDKMVMDQAWHIVNNVKTGGA